MGPTLMVSFLGLLLASLVLLYQSLVVISAVEEPCCALETVRNKNHAASCKRGWKAYEGFCFGLFNRKLSWKDAEAKCRKLGAHLASIHFAQDMVHVAKYIRKSIRGGGNVWIGMHSPKKNRQWQWVDHTSVRYLPWDDGEPNNYLFNENCVELLSKKGYMRWNDKKCKSHRSYLCQMFAV